MLIAVVLYFTLACMSLALLFLPEARSWAAQRVHRAWARGPAKSRLLATRGADGLGAAAQAVTSAADDAGSWFSRHVALIGAALLTITVPPGVAVLLRLSSPLSTFDHTRTHEVNEQVTALLQGEQLVPPPPVAPELFMTREIEQARPLIREGDRRWELLDAEFRKRLLVVYRLMEERHGYHMVLLEGYRTPQRQARLAELGPQVTRAGANESYHQFGLAADSAFLRDGRIVISERDPWAMRGYELLGEVAQSAGLAWGGSWTLRDYGHVELRRQGVTSSRGGGGRAASEQ